MSSNRLLLVDDEPELGHAFDVRVLFRVRRRPSAAGKDAVAASIRPKASAVCFGVGSI